MVKEYFMIWNDAIQNDATQNDALGKSQERKKTFTKTVWDVRGQKRGFVEDCVDLKSLREKKGYIELWY